MNKQKPPKGIEWTRVYGRDGYTWNPIAGCFHGCTWRMPDDTIIECYAKTIAERFESVYPRGFEHHYYFMERLNEPLLVQKPSGIFVCSMSDLFGHWVEDWKICNVLNVARQAHWHIFFTLSKYPVRIPNFNPFPDNVWVGVSLPAGRLMPKHGAERALNVYLRQMHDIEAKIRFVSFEPLWFDPTDVLLKHIEDVGALPFEWAIIGAASHGRKTFQPQEDWVTRLLKLLDSQNIPVFFKGNLDYSPKREYFP